MNLRLDIRPDVDLDVDLIMVFLLFLKRCPPASQLVSYLHV